VLSIPEPLLEELRAHRARQAALGFEQVGADQLVFITRSGRSPGRNNVARAIRNAARNLGFGTVGAHDCRHSCASMLRSLGFTSERIALYLRHASVRTTEAIYGGWAEEDRAKARAEAAAAFS
jgi:integrase